ncbi:DUF1194 domain-containing protein (plasmid) [Paracoccus sp. TK19116]|uniref:DUF1194 domain-containing protein n=1 Tax=Paracoccus albicereus TaxID=2922394 RepID=A0ABT1MMH8_9RHOB|nr:DUF1194 domain-containing protein [Paracoccus albicereus]MCQ0969492.1 DUF1194 domain-containing protein [Paracoccus albicereus]
MRPILTVSALILSALLALPAAAQDVDLELVLITDASGSIDPVELQMQRGGYASALTSPEVLAAIGNTAYGSIAVTYLEFAANTDVVVPWTTISNQAEAQAFADALSQAPRRAYGGNVIGAALMQGADLIEGNEIDGWRKVIDFSSDSLRNMGGPSIEAAREYVLAAGITINGLPVLCLDPCSGRPAGPNLEQEYQDRLIGGNGAFLVTADSDQSFADAVKRKLIVEISGRHIGAPRDLANR